jgi:DNA-binding NarL/FixJ family response regulator
MIRVVIADDQPLMRDALRTVIDLQADMTLVGEAADGDEAVTHVLSERPDVAVLDIRMPRLDGIAATREVTRSTDTRVLILTTFEDDDYPHAALKAGASGFLIKNSPPEEILKAIRVVSSGEGLLAPSVTMKLIKQVAAAAPTHDPTLNETLDTLTARETDVLRDIAQGMSNAEIGRHLYIGEGTVKTHVSRILLKLGARDRVQAVVYAYESGLVTPGNMR